MYDLIGDIHGYADELVQVLENLGYQKAKGAYRHPERQVIFLGDFIDRGPKIRQVLEIVRPMVEERSALAVMGNHELNALAFHTEDSNRAGTFLRKRSIKNIRQHGQTILQLNDEELSKSLEWFRTLPLWLDLDGLRVVHACWDEREIAKITDALEGRSEITPAFLQAACKKGNPLFAAVEVALKGKEAACRKASSLKMKAVPFAPIFAHAGTCPPKVRPTERMRSNRKKSLAIWRLRSR